MICNTSAAADWVKLGPAGIPVATIAQSLSDPNRLYLQVYSGGRYTSSDGGESWNDLPSNGSPVDLRVIEVDPTNAAVVYAGSGHPYYGVFKSTDNGTTWSDTGILGIAADIAIAPSNASVLYVGLVGFGARRSDNGGGSWTDITAGLSHNDVRVLTVHPTDASTVYAATAGGGIHMSTSGGTTWTLMNTGLTSLDVRALVIDPANPTTLYAGTADAGIFKSVDGGATWSAASTGLTGLAVRTLAIDPTTPSTVYAGTLFAGIFKSTDGGGSWSPASAGALAADVRTVVVHPTNGGTVYAATTSGGLFRSTDGGATWSTRNPTGTQHLAEALVTQPGNPTTLFAGTRGGGVFKSTDSGASWIPVNQGLLDSFTLDFQSMHIAAIATDPTAPGTMYAAAREQVYKTTNGGASWTATGALFRARWLLVDPNTPSIVYAATVFNGLRKSLDGGSTWGSAGVDDLSINGIAFDPVSSSTVYVSVGGVGVYKTTDSGAVWTLMNTGLATLAVRALTIDPLSPSTVYLGSDSALWKSTDGGASWASILAQASARAVLDPANPNTIYSNFWKTTDGGATWIPLPIASTTSTLVASSVLYGVGSDGVSALSCGDSVIQSWESCDDGNFANGDCCSSVCTLDAPATPCNAGSCFLPACDGAGTCVLQDADGDSTGDLCDNCVAASNPDQQNTDCPDPLFGTPEQCAAPTPLYPGCCDGGDVCDSCPALADNPAGCGDGSAAIAVGSEGGSTTTPDGTASILIPPGALSTSTTISLTENSDSLALDAGGSTVLSFSASPPGQTFAVPVQFTFSWNDRDEDGLVDLGTCVGGDDDGDPCDASEDCASGLCTVASSSLSESDLVLKRDGQPFGSNGFGSGPYNCGNHLSGACMSAVANCTDSPGTGLATVANCCNPATEDWIFQTCSFSEFVLGLRIAGLVPGGGSPFTDCHAEWNPQNPRNEPYLDKKGLPNFLQTCIDGDRTCDGDEADNGQCVFRVSVSLNLDDPRLRDRLGAQACQPLAVQSWTLLKPRLDSANAIDAANASATMDAMKALGPHTQSGKHLESLVYGSSLAGEVDSAVFSITVPLKGAALDKKGVKVVKMRSETIVPPGKPKGIRDVDKLKLVCLPSP